MKNSKGNNQRPTEAPISSGEKKGTPKPTFSMMMRFRLPGKDRPRFENVDGCVRILDGFSKIWEKYPDADIISFDGHEVKRKI